MPGSFEEELTNKLEIEQAKEENVEIRKEETAAVETAVTTSRPRPVSLGAILDELVPSDRAAELSGGDEDEKTAARESQVGEPSLDTVETKRPVEVRNRAALANDEIEAESVKPMDTIELDFQELIGSVSTHKIELRSPDGVNKTSVDKIGFGK